jgi:hypothetical protein
MLPGAANGGVRPPFPKFFGARKGLTDLDTNFLYHGYFNAPPKQQVRLQCNRRRLVDEFKERDPS